MTYSSRTRNWRGTGRIVIGCCRCIPSQASLNASENLEYAACAGPYSGEFWPEYLAFCAMVKVAMLVFPNKEISLQWEMSSFLIKKKIASEWELQYGRHKKALWT